MDELISDYASFTQQDTTLLEKRSLRWINWLSCGSFKLSWMFALMYLLTILYGIRYMQKRAPFNLRSLLFMYDLGLAFFNAHIVYGILKVAVKENFFFTCQKADYAHHPHATELTHSLWLFHASKLIECLDTVFFILSGKTRLVTWLHVYHHCTMIPYSFMMAKWTPDDQVFTFVLTNGSVHVIMYIYYALAALGPAWRRFLWWKRYLTILQMMQFVYGISVAVWAVYNGCTARPIVYYCSIAYIFSILACFYNHYTQTYYANRHTQRHTKHTEQPEAGTTIVKDE
ncbi:hypothetical protein EG68_04887 [Paragonimus skrjabini miyazakii]|uniref:Elongation of very long chain fatty acids protein n=1 Tax=Paragonimus skrjabini miyazakii TaxID=59628 RepID=A0A8S9YZ39_9TREM|nr:hypothetical protein EG68_04887 [Paragonimus skrjabini miyazakii]